MLTTCAQDYVTWKNEYPEGADRVRGVTVRRFASARDPRHRRVQHVLGVDLQQRAQPRRRDGVAEAAGAVVPRRSSSYLTPQPPAVRRPDLLHVSLRADRARPRGRTGAQRARVDRARRAGDPARDLQGRLPEAGSALLPHRQRAPLRRACSFPIGRCSRRSSASASIWRRQQPYPRIPAPPADEEPGAVRRRRRRRHRAGDRIEDDAPTLDSPAHLKARGAVFRRRHRLYGPMVLYGGRIDPGKGCEELIQYFSEYVKEGGDATLVLMGVEADDAAGGSVRSASPGACRIASGCRRSRPPRSSSARRRTRACRCWRSRRCRSARRCSPTRAAPCSSSTASAATAACTTPTATSSWNALKLLVGDDHAARRRWAATARIRPPELPLGRRARQVRASLREDQERALVPQPRRREKAEEFTQKKTVS